MTMTIAFTQAPFILGLSFQLVHSRHDGRPATAFHLAGSWETTNETFFLFSYFLFLFFLWIFVYRGDPGFGFPPANTGRLGER